MQCKCVPQCQHVGENLQTPHLSSMFAHKWQIGFCCGKNWLILQVRSLTLQSNLSTSGAVQHENRHFHAVNDWLHGKNNCRHFVRQEFSVCLFFRCCPKWLVTIGQQLSNRNAWKLLVSWVIRNCIRAPWLPPYVVFGWDDEWLDGGGFTADELLDGGLLGTYRVGLPKE